MLRFCIFAFFLVVGFFPFHVLAQETTPQVAEPTDASELEKQAAKQELAGDILGAIQTYGRAIALSPNNWSFYYRRAGLNVANKEYQAASSDYDKALKNAPSQANCIDFAKAFLLAEDKQPKKAMDTLIKLLDSKEDDPFKASVLVNLSILRLKNQEIKPDNYPYPVERDLDAAIRLNPKSEHAYYNRGVYRFYQESYREASNDFSQALEVEEDYKKASVSLGIAEEALKKSTLSPDSNIQPITQTRQLNTSKKKVQRFSLGVEHPKGMDYDFYAQGENSCAIDFASYMAVLKAKVRSVWNAPNLKSSIKSIINFKVAKDGSIQDPVIKQSSSFEKADEAALQAIQKASPFAPLPLLYRGKYIEINFTFDINVFEK